MLPEEKSKGHVEFKKIEIQIILQGSGMIHSDSGINIHVFLHLKEEGKSVLVLGKEAQTNNKLRQDGKYSNHFLPILTKK